jgi:hypothetical protein
MAASPITMPLWFCFTVCRGCAPGVQQTSCRDALCCVAQVLRPWRYPDTLEGAGKGSDKRGFDSLLHEHG